QRAGARGGSLDRAATGMQRGHLALPIVAGGILRRAAGRDRHPWRAGGLRAALGGGGHRHGALTALPVAAAEGGLATVVLDCTDRETCSSWWPRAGHSARARADRDDRDRARGLRGGGPDRLRCHPTSRGLPPPVRRDRAGAGRGDRGPAPIASTRALPSARPDRSPPARPARRSSTR